MPESEPKTELKKISFEGGEILADGQCLAWGLDNDSVEKVRGQEWLDSFYSNFEKKDIRNAPDASQIHNLFQNKNALCVVVGNGPSFHENIDSLKALCDKKRPFILACDRVFNKLCEHGIRPDLTITLDGQARVAEFFEKSYVCSNDYFVAMLTTHSDVIEKIGAGKIFWGGLAVHQKKNVDGPNTLTSPIWEEIYSKAGLRFYNTVGNYVVGDMATRLAATMGFEGVVSLGNDLCFRDFKGDKYEGGYNKYPIVIKWDTGDRDYITTEPFLLAAMKFSEMPKIYPNTVFYDCSDAPIFDWNRGKLSDMVYEILTSEEEAYRVYNYRWQLQKRHYYRHNG